jgi:hypothetical protein
MNADVLIMMMWQIIVLTIGGVILYRQGYRDGKDAGRGEGER